MFSDLHFIRPRRARSIFPRAVYTVKFKGSVFVLHVFQKKSKTGRETPKHEIDLIKRRLAKATDSTKD